MSDEEKAAQIGKAVLLLEEQKRTQAHLTAKADKVCAAYRRFAAERERWRVNGDVVTLSHPQPDERELPLYLLSQADLAALVGEMQEVGEAIRQTKARLAAFGVTGG